MEQVIEAQLREKEICSEVEAEFEVITLHNEEVMATRALYEEVFTQYTKKFFDYYYENKASDNTVFAVKQEELLAMLQLTPYSAAIRRNPPLPGANRLPCMADVVRVDTFLMTGIATKEAYRGRGYMKRVMESALSYQYKMKTPFTFVASEDTELFQKFGFHAIYDKEEHELNKDLISEQLLYRAMEGETVSLNPSNITLSVVDKSELLTLAHFVNACLCRQYGLFVIRSAVYYELLQKEMISQGGNIFVMKENQKLIGYFTWAKQYVAYIQEAVFEEERNIDRYFYTAKEKKPVTMARIVNLKEMLKHVSSNGKVIIAIRIKDPVIAENDGLFNWYLDEKGSTIERMEEPENSAYRPEVTATIGELTAFLFGYKKLKQGLKFDSIYLSGPAWMNEKQ